MKNAVLLDKEEKKKEVNEIKEKDNLKVLSSRFKDDPMIPEVPKEVWVSYAGLLLGTPCPKGTYEPRFDVE